MQVSKINPLSFNGVLKADIRNWNLSGTNNSKTRNIPASDIIKIHPLDGTSNTELVWISKENNKVVRGRISGVNPYKVMTAYTAAMSAPKSTVIDISV